jgi:hypothetical protein
MTDNKMTENKKKEKQKVGIPEIFKVSGVSFHRTVVDNLKENEQIFLEKDPKNKYDTNAIKIVNSKGEMCGFVPKKYSIKQNEIILNELVLKKYEKLTIEYKLIVHSVYKWDGPTGLEVRFQKNIL